MERITDYRHQLWIEEHRKAKQLAKKASFRVELGPQPKRAPFTVDTSKARSNIDVVRLCLQELGWKEYPLGRQDGRKCDFCWLATGLFDYSLVANTKVNKFPGMVDTVNKITLSRMLDAMAQLYPEQYSFYPRAWYLPQQFVELCEYASRQYRHNGKKTVFIVKPDDGTQGEGIYLLTDPYQYQFNGRNYIVQEYVANPLLLDGLKFDLRVYVVLTQLKPLTIYMCREGLARFCTVPYSSPTALNLHESYMHLTNYSLNKHSNAYQHTSAEDSGSKRTLSSVLQQLKSRGYDTKTIVRDIEQLAVSTLIAITPAIKVEMHNELTMQKTLPTCFQILGFDVLLRDDGKPLLLEVNANPSLRIDFEKELKPGICQLVHSAVDEDIKRPLVYDTLLLVSGALQAQRASNSASAATAAAPTIIAAGATITATATTATTTTATAGATATATAGVEVQDMKPVLIEAGGDLASGAPVTHLAGDVNDLPVTQTGDYAPASSGDTAQQQQQQVGDKPVVTVTSSTNSRLAAGVDVREYRPYGVLKQISPSRRHKLAPEGFLLDRLADVFIDCLGVGRSRCMGQSAFRLFTRKYKLNNLDPDLTNAAIDLLYIEFHRRWLLAATNQPQNGLCFQGFIEVFFSLARRLFGGKDMYDNVVALLRYCEEQHAPTALQSSLSFSSSASLRHSVAPGNTGSASSNKTSVGTIGAGFNDSSSNDGNATSDVSSVAPNRHWLVSLNDRAGTSDTRHRLPQLRHAKHKPYVE